MSNDKWKVQWIHDEDHERVDTEEVHDTLQNALQSINSLYKGKYYLQWEDDSYGLVYCRSKLKAIIKLDRIKPDRCFNIDLYGISQCK
jgi:hypothetical protein